MSSSHRNPWYRSRLALAGLLLLATAAVYQGVSDCDFINLDDETYVQDNPHVQGGIAPRNLAWALATTESANWHPVTWISLQLDAAIYGKRPAGYHLTNVLLHCANTILLFLVLCRMTGSSGLSAVVAALFGLHPLHVESVAWVFERKDVLSTLFWILALGAYARYVGRRGFGAYLVVLLTFGLALASKPMAVTLPCVLLLLDYWPLQLVAMKPQGSSPSRRVLNLFWQKLPLFTLSAACSLITVYGQQIAMRSVEEYPLSTRLGNAAVAYVNYLGMTFWPVRLSIFYPYESNQSVLWQSGATLLLASITLLVLYQARRRFLFVGWFWYLGTLVPVIGIIQVGLQAMADRYTYIPSIGLFIALVWAAADLFARIGIPAWIRLGLATSACLACAWLTNAQVGQWHDSRTLWEHILRASPDNYFAHQGLGGYFAKHGPKEEAIRHFRLAIQNNPYEPRAYQELGRLLLEMGRSAEFIELWKEGLRYRPNQADWHHNLGQALLLDHKPVEAVEHLREAVRLQPDLAGSHWLLYSALKDTQPVEAQRHKERAETLMPELRHTAENDGRKNQ